MSETLEQEIRLLRAHFWSERDPDGRAFAPLADAYRRKGDVEEARALLDDGLGRHPDFATGHLVDARVRRAAGDDEAALGALDRLLELDPGNASGHRMKGELLEAAGRAAEAAEAFRHALGLDRNYEDLEGRIARLGSDAPDGPEPEAPGPDDFPEVEDAERLLFDDFSPDDFPPASVEPGLQSGAEDLPWAEDALDVDLPDVDFSVDDVPLDDLESGTVPEPGYAWGEAVRSGEEGASEDPSFEESEEDEAPTHTRTLGELYARQGLVPQAVDVYERLLRKDPENEELARRLEELRELGSGPAGAPEPGDEPAAVPSETAEGGRDEDDGSGSAPQWAMGDEDAPVTTPFAWVPESAEGEASPGEGDAGRGRSIHGYFEDLLAWVPGAVPVESLAPDEPSGEGEAGGTTGRAAGEGAEAAGEGSESAEGGLEDLQDWLRDLGR